MQDILHQSLFTATRKKRGLYFLEVEVIWIESFLCKGSELFPFSICLLFDYRRKRSLIIGFQSEPSTILTLYNTLYGTVQKRPVLL